MRQRAFAILLLLGLAHSAWAEEDNADRETARRHYDAGVDRFDAGEYRAALEEFLTSQRLFRVPAFDYNIALCYERLRELDLAIDYYERFVRTDSPEVARVRVHLAELKREWEAARPKPPVRSHRRRNLAIVLGVLGGAAVVGVSVALGVTLSRSEASFSPSTLGPMRVTP